MSTPASEMFSNPGDEVRIAQAWESFLGGQGVPVGQEGPAQTPGLRQLVDTSWQRCQQARVDPNQRSGPQPVSDQDLFLLRERQRELMEASAPVMACARDFLAETGTMMALADAHATILSVEGDDPTKDSAELIRLMPGVRWSEGACGTNAIGTALTVGQAVQVHSAEHYCAGIKRWTCSAAVVHHPADGEVVGVVDVSGLSQTYHRQSLALVVTTASRIESRLTMREMELRYRLLELGMSRWNSSPRHVMALYDRRGNLVKLSEHAEPALMARGAGSGMVLDTPALRRLPALARRHPAPGELPPWLLPEWLEPLLVRGERLGTLLRLPMPGASPAARRAPPTAAVPALHATTMDTTPIPDSFTAILTGNAAMQEVIARARQLARARPPVLLHGETGVGKEEFARGLHGTQAGPFVALNCGGMSRELLASELFGYAEGAFTGARKGGMVGKFEAADGGTLFLDEIGEMPLDMQPHLLRVLEQGEICRLGENTPRQVNFRLVAATNRDLRAEVAAGRFRMDLFYRVAVTSLRIPPLRARGEDVRLLARHFLARVRQEQGHPPRESEPLMSPGVEARLLVHPWPGNVRELRNVIESMAVLADGGLVTEQHLPPELGMAAATPAASSASAAHDPPPAQSVSSIAEGEEMLIRRAIAACGGNLTQAARQLGIAKSTLYAKMRRHGLGRE